MNFFKRFTSRVAEANDARVKAASDRLMAHYGLPTHSEVIDILSAALALHKVAERLVMLDAPRKDSGLKIQASTALSKARKARLLNLCKRHLPAKETETIYGKAD